MAQDDHAQPEGQHPDRQYEVTVLLDGVPKPERFPARITVLEAIRMALAPKDKPKASDFLMVDAANSRSPLDHSQTLEAAGVRDGHTLSITKKDGGGG
ncbi:MAG TPA: hypothetical protein VHL79_06355 [Ramlibacter sp.]|nr:hypothetical protein [Ramlibacter sp.]